MVKGDGEEITAHMVSLSLWGNPTNDCRRGTDPLNKLRSFNGGLAAYHGDHPTNHPI